MTLLSEKVAEPDLAGLGDWEVAQVLNAPDPSLPEIVTQEKTLVGPAAIMDALGPVAGAEFLNAIQAASLSEPVLYWGLHEITNGGLDVSRANVRQQILGLQQTGLLTEVQSAALLALADRRRHPSWAEYHNIKVTDHTVGEARLAAGE
jgi:hypothetical protein